MLPDPEKSKGEFIELGAWYRGAMLSSCLGRYQTLVGWDSEEGRRAEAVAQKIIRGGPAPRLTLEDAAICARATARARDDSRAAGHPLDENYLELARQFAELSGMPRTSQDIAHSAHEVMAKVLANYRECTQAQWAEDTVTSKLTKETHYVNRAERAFVLQGFSIDLKAAVLNRPRLREIFPSTGPSVLEDVPEFARELFQDSNTGGMISRAGRIETGVADRRVRYSDAALIKALSEIKQSLSPEEFSALELGAKLFSET